MRFLNHVHVSLNMIYGGVRAGQSRVFIAAGVISAVVHVVGQEEMSRRGRLIVEYV